MKKVLTILLTLVMAVSLINLNNSHTKAAETNGTTYTITYDGDWNFTSRPQGNIYSVGDVLSITVSKEAKFIDELGNTTKIASGTTFTYTITKDNLTDGIDGNALVLLNVCNGISFDGTNWKNGNDTITDTSTPKKLSDFGIEYDATTKTAKFSKSLITLTANNTTLTIGAPLTIELSKDIEILQGGGGASHSQGKAIYVKSNGVTIDGNNHALIVATNENTHAILVKNGTASNDAVDLTLKNITIDCSNNPVAEENVAISIENNLILRGNCLIKTYSFWVESVSALKTGGVVKFVEDATTGTLEGNTTGPKTATETVTKNANGYYVLSDNTTLAKYVEIKQTVPPHEQPFDCSTASCSVTTERGKDVSAHIADKEYSNVKDKTTVTLNGKALAKDTDFRLSSGSVYVTIKKEYLSGLAAGTHNFIITITDAGTSAYPLTITIKDQPSPSDPEDKSCEKVIGPTWHWNNDKGICEDYGVVGTATR